MADKLARAMELPGTERACTYLIDPPWMERGAGKVKRGADRHYPLLHTADIPAVIARCPIFDPPENAHLYLWATNNHLEDALFVMRAIGFRYVTNVAWLKMRDGRPQFGLGQYFRGGHELLLFGVRGRGTAVRTEDRSVPGVMLSPRTKHSSKPDVVYELVERRSRGPHAELFGRGKPRAGWQVWGNEAEPEERGEDR